MAHPIIHMDGEENLSAPYFSFTNASPIKESEENHVLAFAPQWSYGSKSMG